MTAGNRVAAVLGGRTVLQHLDMVDSGNRNEIENRPNPRPGTLRIPRRRA